MRCHQGKCQKKKGFYETSAGAYTSFCEREDSIYADANLEKCPEDVPCEGAKYFAEDGTCKDCPQGHM